MGRLDRLGTLLAMTNRSGWRAKVLDVYGQACVVRRECEGPTEAHHLIFRSQGGPDRWENGIPLCRFHHGQVHSRWLKVDPRWLAPAAIEWLAVTGNVRWDEAGMQSGRHWRNFQRR